MISLIFKSTNLIDHSQNQFISIKIFPHWILIHELMNCLCSYCKISKRISEQWTSVVYKMFWIMSVIFLGINSWILECIYLDYVEHCSYPIINLDIEHQYFKFMNRLISNEKSKLIFLIGIIGIGAGFTAKNVISYPTECSSLNMVALRWNTTGKTFW